MSILNVNKINPVGGGSTITIAGIASVTNNLTATNISAGSSVTANSFHGDEIKLGDNKKILLGTGSDLEIYHSGSGAAILNSDTSTQLTIASDNALNLTSRTGTEYYFRAYPNNRAELYYDYSTYNTPKLQTSTVGVTVNGTVTDSKGELRNFPQVSVSSQHTIVASDAGKHIKNTSGGWIINGSTGFAVGDVCRIINASDSGQVLTQSGVTLYSRRDGGVSGNHSIVDRGAAIIICTGSNEYYVSGDI